jgi:prolyl-tRNA editing enzyme YbaK/EbsC (Cys-tRNA(Pro) deacylase)
MNQNIINAICGKLEDTSIKYHLIEHPPCRTSAESAETRAKSGFPNTVGAKALVVKMTFVGNKNEFNVLVLPGTARLDSQKIKLNFSDLKKFRFATTEELFELCGVPSGAMPPFGNSIFPNISNLYIDDKIRDCETVGFNAGFLEKSIVMKTCDYLEVADYQQILSFSEI